MFIRNFFCVCGGRGGGVVKNNDVLSGTTYQISSCKTVIGIALYICNVYLTSINKDCPDLHLICWKIKAIWTNPSNPDNRRNKRIFYFRLLTRKWAEWNSLTLHGLVSLHNALKVTLHKSRQIFSKGKLP